MTKEEHSLIDQKIATANRTIVNATKKRDTLYTRASRADSLERTIKDYQEKLEKLQEPGLTGNVYFTIDGKTVTICVNTPEMMEHVIEIFKLNLAKIEAEYEKL